MSSSINCQDLIELFNVHCSNIKSPDTNIQTSTYLSKYECIIDTFEKEKNTPFFYITKKCKLKNNTQQNYLNGEDLFSKCCLIHDIKCINSLQNN